MTSSIAKTNEKEELPSMRSSSCKPEQKCPHALIVAVAFSSSQNLTKQKFLASLGIQALIKLDADGRLRKLIEQENWAVIRQFLDVSLPIGVSFDLIIYDEHLHVINSQVIQNTSSLSRETVSVRYICVNERPNFQVNVLDLWLAWIGERRAEKKL